MVVPAFASWHEAHDDARVLLAKQPRLPGHAALEAYSVLTRLPPPHRMPGQVIREFLARRFPSEAVIVPSPDLIRGMVDRCEKAGVTGGGVYDALVGLTAAEVEANLFTRDQRAARIYRALAVDFTLMP